MVSEEFRHLDTNIVLALTKARSDFNSTSIGFSGNSINYSKELSTQYAFFKWDESLYWENHKKQLTPVELSETVAASSSSRGPTSLRKASGGAINMLFIDMAKQNLPSLRYTKAFADGSAAPMKKKYSVNIPGMKDISFLAQSSPPVVVGSSDKPRSFHNSKADSSIGGHGETPSHSEGRPPVAATPAGEPQAPVAADQTGARSWSSFLSSTAASVSTVANAAVANANTAMATFNEGKASAPERPGLTKKLSARFW